MRIGLKERLRVLKKTRIFLSNAEKKKEIILIHSSSLGEWEQAVPIIEKIKSYTDSYLFVATFFSPSGLKAQKQNVADFITILPFDGYFSMNIFFKILRPSIVIISKYDVWPNFLFHSKKIGAKVYLCSAEMADNSLRHKGLMQPINSILYKDIDAIFCVSDSHRNNIRKIYKAQTLYSFGDARYDRILSKSESIKGLKIFDNDNFTLIAASVWKNDCEILLPALVKLAGDFPDIQFIIVPHEMSSTLFSFITHSLENAKITVDFYSAFSKTGNYCNARVAIIDTVGVLAQIYAHTQLAYVGGSFGKGVHNVLESAAYAQPVLYGPRYKNSYEAEQLVKLGGAFTIKSSNDLYYKIRVLLTNKDFFTEAANISYQFLKESRGASNRIFEYLDKVHHFKKKGK
ncbi:MAG: hypothetical protein IPO21_17955 [Bacteroidales bacterium]|nr:hypothetical protein [Bacteroidales bacterium]